MVQGALAAAWHMIVFLQNVNALERHGGFYPDFKGRSKRPGKNVQQGWDPRDSDAWNCDSEAKATVETPGSGRCQECGYLLTKAAVSEWSQSATSKAQGQGCPYHLELTAFHLMSQRPSMELWDLIFALLSFGLVLVQFFSILCLNFRMGLFAPCHLVPWECVTCFLSFTETHS